MTAKKKPNRDPIAELHDLAKTRAWASRIVGGDDKLAEGTLGLIAGVRQLQASHRTAIDLLRTELKDHRKRCKCDACAFVKQLP